MAMTIPSEQAKEKDHVYRQEARCTEAAHPRFGDSN
jgi:hypothetical protein